MTKRKVLQPLRRNGERYDPGESVDISDRDARPLIEAGVLVGDNDTDSGGTDAPSSGDGGGELSQEERNAKIRQVLTEMLEEDPKQENNLLWTKAGDPRNKVVDSRTGLDVTNDELGPIWAELKPKD